MLPKEATNSSSTGLFYVDNLYLQMVKYIFPVVCGAITLLACNVEYRSGDEKHAQAIKEELAIFIDTVKGITLCQAWIPGKEGEPIIYFYHGVGSEDTTMFQRQLIIAGEKVLKIICSDDDTPPVIGDTMRIPYMQIDYIDYQACKHSSYLGQGMTLYLGSTTGQNMIH